MLRVEWNGIALIAAGFVAYALHIHFARGVGWDSAVLCLQLPDLLLAWLMFMFRDVTLVE